MKPQTHITPAGPATPGGTVAPSAQLAALELIADVLARAENEAGPNAFYRGLCEAVCRITRMRRAVIFGYDDVLHEVRALGAHGVDQELFADAQVTVESTPIAAHALEQDSVIEVHDDPPSQLPPEYAPLVAESALFCTPMVAAGRQIGVIVSDREAGSPILTEGERSLLWIFGKMAALASMAGTAARQAERARLLEQRLDLARELHEHVVQRLFGVSLALSSQHELDRAERDRCAEELSAAAGDLRSLVQRSDADSPRRAPRSLGDELARLQREHPGLGIVVGEPTHATVPDGLEPLVQSVLAEAVRNAHKHARPSRVEVRARSDAGAFVLEVENDGVREEPAGTVAGMGLRLAAFDALEHGGFVEFGPRPDHAWQVKLVVPESTA